MNIEYLNTRSYQCVARCVAGIASSWKLWNHDCCLSFFHSLHSFPRQLAHPPRWHTCLMPQKKMQVAHLKLAHLLVELQKRRGGTLNGGTPACWTPKIKRWHTCLLAKKTKMCHTYWCRTFCIFQTFVWRRRIERANVRFSKVKRVTSMSESGVQDGFRTLARFRTNIFVKRTGGGRAGWGGKQKAVTPFFAKPALWKKHKRWQLIEKNTESWQIHRWHTCLLTKK